MGAQERDFVEKALKATILETTHNGTIKTRNWDLVPVPKYIPIRSFLPHSSSLAFYHLPNPRMTSLDTLDTLCVCVCVCVCTQLYIEPKQLVIQLISGERVLGALLFIRSVNGKSLSPSQRVERSYRLERSGRKGIWAREAQSLDPFESQLFPQPHRIFCSL